MSTQWKETKREFDIDADNNELLKRVSREVVDDIKTQREKWEFIFKIISALGIVVTLIGIWVNVQIQNKQIESQSKRLREEYNNKVYQNALRDLFIINSVDADDTLKGKASNNYLTEVLPTLYLVSNVSIRQSLQSTAKCLDEIKKQEALKAFLYYVRDKTQNTALFGRDTLFDFDAYRYGYRAINNALKVIENDSLMSIKEFIEQDKHSLSDYLTKLISKISSLSDSANHVEYLMNDADLDILGPAEIASVKALFYQNDELIEDLIFLDEKYHQRLIALQNTILSQMSQLNSSGN